MVSRPSTTQDQTLLIDADDTLWENNLYFERAIESFAELFRSRYDLTEIRSAIDETENRFVERYGYGSASFGRALLDCCERLNRARVTPVVRTRIEAMARSVRDYPIALLPGVAETLPRLAARRELILVTKGDASEQRAKLGRSGLKQYFSAVEVLREKNVHSYRALCTRHALRAARTWMIGNSPRSDVNPALGAGLHAVYVHYSGTWSREQADFAVPSKGQRLVQVESFAALQGVFEIGA